MVVPITRKILILAVYLPIVDSAGDHAIPMSVIIFCFNRRQFLKDALLSVINQTFPREKYEIILTKNFKDDEIDSMSEQHGVRCLLEGNVNIGEMIANASLVARGKYICFLDDDDRFHPNKLRRVYSEVTENSGILYYHNAFSAIDDRGNVLNDNSHVQPDKPLLLNSTNQERRVRISKHFSGDINTSSIALKRDLIIEYIDYIRSISGLQDVFFFYLSAISREDIILDSEILTDYRIHTSESHGDLKMPEKFSAGMLSVLEKYLKSYSMLYSMSSALKGYIRYEYITNKCRIELISNSKYGFVSFRDLLFVLVHPGYSQVYMRELYLVIFSILQRIAPDKVNRFYITRKMKLEQKRYTK